MAKMREGSSRVTVVLDGVSSSFDPWGFLFEGDVPWGQRFPGPGVRMIVTGRSSTSAAVDKALADARRKLRGQLRDQERLFDPDSV